MTFWLFPTRLGRFALLRSARTYPHRARAILLHTFNSKRFDDLAPKFHPKAWIRATLTAPAAGGGIGSSGIAASSGMVGLKCEYSSARKETYIAEVYFVLTQPGLLWDDATTNVMTGSLGGWSSPPPDYTVFPTMVTEAFIHDYIKFQFQTYDASAAVDAAPDFVGDAEGVYGLSGAIFFLRSVI